MTNQTKFFFIALLIVVLGSACTKSDPVTYCSMQIKYSDMNFNVVDASTGKDLFFSDNPRYTVDQIAFFKTKDKLFKEGWKPQVIGSGAQRYFTVTIGAESVDTLLMKLPISGGNEAVDVFSFTLKPSKEPCEAAVLDKAKLNNVDIVKTNGRLIIKKVQPVN
ncbi:hypothetical protein [Pedobacter sp. FW305-3-2-15-E-R2A2]|uniref:hypothetical protein n=1 Tax=Pedobacter sp. FW305-3-2-15-E-R2A2 TaxID=3140251 RepID=UPI0031402D63